MNEIVPGIPRLMPLLTQEQAATIWQQGATGSAVNVKTLAEWAWSAPPRMKRSFKTRLGIRSAKDWCATNLCPAYVMTADDRIIRIRLDERGTPVPDRPVSIHPPGQGPRPRNRALKLIRRKKAKK
jgi:hypothetical protein